MPHAAIRKEEVLVKTMIETLRSRAAASTAWALSYLLHREVQENILLILNAFLSLAMALVLFRAVIA